MRSELPAVFLCWALIGASLVAQATEGGSRLGVNGAIPHLDDAAAQAAGLSGRAVKEATKIYTSKCMRCHKSYEARAYAQPEWETWMVKMRKKARLDAEQQELLGRFLDAYRADPNTIQTNRATGQ